MPRRTASTRCRRPAHRRPGSGRRRSPACRGPAPPGCRPAGGSSGRWPARPVRPGPGAGRARPRRRRRPAAAVPARPSPPRPPRRSRRGTGRTTGRRTGQSRPPGARAVATVAMKWPASEPAPAGHRGTHRVRHRQAELYERDGDGGQQHRQRHVDEHRTEQHRRVLAVERLEDAEQEQRHDDHAGQARPSWRSGPGTTALRGRWRWTTRGRRRPGRAATPRRSSPSR